jgi:2-polyprenyl-3-methyl-5-hydroxy-6-metoxy-1,4-benzoquinol methylase
MHGAYLGFQPASFDVVLSFEVLEHMPGHHQHAYVSEIHRVLRPGGLLVLSTPNRDVFSQGYKTSLNKYHVNELSVKELERLLAQHFHVASLYGQYFRHPAMRQRDIDHLRQQFTLKKRLKRSLIRAVDNSKILRRVYGAYKQVISQGPTRLYPFAIASEDFAFDTTHVDIAKWFVCLCEK